MTTEQQAIRIEIPRHLQDFNGYCGPACALMVIDFAGSKKSPPVFAQNDFFREVRNHAKKAADRRPIKSPAESLLHLLNDHAGGATRWEKIYQEESLPVGEAILQAVEGQGQPCLIMVNRGMHWVVAFGMLKKPDGTPSGLLMRDPAWAGMPKFYGLSIFPDEPAIEHCQSPCTCLEAINAKENKRTGKVHERFFTINELLSHRGLQGSLDWEGKGAIALVPEGSQTGPARLASTLATGVAAAGIPIANAKEQAGQAALTAVAESGLTGRPDSPPEWDEALTNARAGEPLLVKDPEDSRDDFFLVPLIPQDPKAKNGAWAMLDARTLELREVSLLADWQAPILPSPEEAHQASNQEVHLPDGTTQKFSAKDLTPNQQNLVWQPSAAAVLPYWPVKEFTAPHPVSGEPVSIYLTQDGKVHGHLGPDEGPQAETPQPETKPPSDNKPKSTKPPKPTRLGKLALTTALAVGIPAAVVVTLLNNPSPSQLHDDDDDDDGDGRGGEEKTSSELLKNPKFETLTSLAGGRDYDRWQTNAGIDEQGRFTGPINTVKPIGSRMLELSGGDNNVERLYQPNLLTTYSHQIASGKATFEASISCNVSQKATGAKAVFNVTFYQTERSSKAAGSPLSKTLVLDGDPRSWEKIELSGAIPRDATWVMTMVHFDSSTLKGSPAYLDDAKLTITVTP